MVNPVILQNIREMCEVRGYNILQEKDNEIITDKCFIIFTNDIKININYIKDLTRIMTEQNIEHVIVIYNGNTTLNAQNINDIKLLYNIEFFNEKSFMYNITKCNLVPKHEKLIRKSEEYKLLVKEKSNLPLIYEHDPVCKYYNFKQGDIVKLTRNNGIIAYRLVI